MTDPDQQYPPLGCRQLFRDMCSLRAECGMSHPVLRNPAVDTSCQYKLPPAHSGLGKVQMGHSVVNNEEVVTQRKDDIVRDLT